ncbi:amidohydrolase family protein [Butyricimonas hominis]|uniref:Amidohydrolase family protein n=1 Tax=Butyricimonas hominis TaxID=2763032 RepID=A0ABR7D301_9BACT|nr:amidohydrolase family protein [Butyricimonas hominis]MBC5622301.1 amidohydrolase family protein [Butyricimonas hominis]
MRKICGLFAVLFVLWLNGTAQEKAIILKNTNVVDVVEGNIREGVDVVVKGGYIQAVGKNAGSGIDGKMKDMTGKYVMPGLIDAHVHIANDPKETQADRAKHLEYFLRHGITSIRDAAGDARVLKDLKEGVEQGKYIGPDIYYAAFMAGPAYFEGNDREKSMVEGWAEPFAPWMQCLRPGDDLDKAMREAKEWGCTGVKIYGGFDREALLPIVRKAKEHGLQVWGHATLFPAKPWDVADAGVQVISHAYMLEWEGVSEGLSGKIFENYEKYYDKIDHENMSVERFLQTVKAKGLIFDPTLFLCMENGMDWSVRFVKRARQIGVKICAGTDYINELSRPFPFLFDELDLYVEKCDFYPMEAIFSVTRVAAEVLGIADKAGAVEVGMQADLLVLNGNPYDNIKELRNIQMVMKRGKILGE